MDIQFVYQKKRLEFGRQCIFVEKLPEVLDNFPSDPMLEDDFILMNPVDQTTQLAPHYAIHDCNTMRAEFFNTGMNHFEGGWPKDVNMNDEEATKRYRRKVEKDENYPIIMIPLLKTMENSILQNNAINIYQLYYSDMESPPLAEKISARTVNVFQDQAIEKRPVNKISWSPDDGNKLAVAHNALVYQDPNPNSCKDAYIWEVENPNQPLHTIDPPVEITCLEYHFKDPSLLASGHINGQVGFWDLRKSTSICEYSVIEASHTDPVRSVLWVHSKAGTEFFSASTDGVIKWWDTRKLQEPIEKMVLDPVKDEEQVLDRAMGACSLDYDFGNPTKFLIGCENGVTISGNRKGKSALEKMVGRYSGHLGPVHAVSRNLAYSKNFLTVGDWTARVWAEDCKESDLIWTFFHTALLTYGAWSPTRCSVFFLTRADGYLDVWDLIETQQEPVLSIKICDCPIRTLRPNPDNGRQVALGNDKGTTYIVELNEGMSVISKADKALFALMLDRENHREKILEARARELKLKAKLKASQYSIVEKEEEFLVMDDPFVQNSEKDYFNVIEEALHPEEAAAAAAAAAAAKEQRDEDEVE